MAFFVTKDMVFDALKHGGVLELGSDTVMTPLARETADKLGVTVKTAGNRGRRPLVAANWKMNHGASATLLFLETFIPLSSGTAGIDMVVCPSHPFLILAGQMLKNTSIDLGSQDAAWEETGAYTGEVSVPMLVDCGCSYAIIGHSERRKYHPGEDERIPAKMELVLKAGITPILCVGEALADREHGRTYRILKRQLDTALASISEEKADPIVLAYEPIWAIGTGQVATVTQVADVHGFLRKTITLRYSRETASKCRILYGGSVNSKNAGSLAALEDVDGFLVGGASLAADSFMDILYQIMSAKAPSVDVLEDKQHQ